MKRRKFLAQAATATIGAGALVACNRSSGEGPAVQTGRRVRWQLASSFPRGLDTIFGAAETLSKRVSAITGDRFQIRVYPAGELVPGTQVLDAVQSGSLQVGHTAGYYYTGKNPVLAFETSVPFGLTARQQNAWLAYGGGLELMRNVFADFNVINFPGGNTGAQMGGWFRREINSVSDLNGLKMRIPGMGGRVMERLGVTPQVLAGGDIYPALERGAIDATEWVGPYDDEKLGFHRVAKNYYYPGWWEPGPTLSFYVNKDEWEKLPSAYQEAFTTAAAEANLDMLASYDAKNPPALLSLMNQGVKLKPFARDIMEAARTASFEIMHDDASSDAGYNKIFTEWKTFREQSYKWFGTAERAFSDFAFPQGAGDVV